MMRDLNSSNVNCNILENILKRVSIVQISFVYC